MVNSMCWMCEQAGVIEITSVFGNTNICVFSPSQRSAEDLEVIYEELLHVKAAAHLSTSVSEEMSGHK